MRIKHFAGYGSVDAKKVSTKSVKDILGDKVTTVVIKVTGNHEWGLERNDSYDVYNWLMKRFCKDADSWTCITDLKVDDHYLDRKGDHGIDVEECTYTITYKTRTY